jgi:hypothetical protein
MPEAAVAIGRGNIGLHIGLLFREKDHAIYLLHLAFHYQPMKVGPRETYSWIWPDLEAEQYDILAATCRDLARTYGAKGLPYAIDYKTEFLDDYSLSDDSPGSGFTCATFVLAVFRRSGIELIDRSSWKSREDDVQWQDQVIRAFGELVASGGATQQEVDAVRAQRGCFRFRPQDVAASTLMTRPVTFDDVRDISDAIAKRISTDS